MEPQGSAAANNAQAAAEHSRQAATSARLAGIDAQCARSGALAGFLREVGEAGLTLADLADWLAAAGAEGIPNFAVGGMLPKDFVFGQLHPGEGLEASVSRAMEEIKGWSAAAFRSAALQPEGDESGRRFIEHGAMCYANCFLRIQRALSDASPPPSEAPS